MLFPTVEYALFFMLVLGASWSLAKHLEWQKAFLLIASYVFYGFWNWGLVQLLVYISLFAGLVAQQIQKNKYNKKEKKRWLIFGIVVCLGVLVFYKYTEFLILSFLDFLGLFGITSSITPEPAGLPPLGISFFVFHAISLLVDVYRDKLKSRLEIGDALLYVAFFPQLIAGPILRASYFIPQLKKPRDPEHIRMNWAFMMIVMGLFKKVVIANTMAGIVDPIFASPESYSGSDILFATYCYSAQIYCDFSGYTDIAIGCAMLLGFRFPKNFNSPYMSASPQEFWRRWHITLSTWLRDYLYIPLGGARKGQWRTNLNLMITMLLGGLWHGANWTFVLWGALHGFYLVVHRLWNSIRWSPLQRMRKTIAWRWIARLLLFHAICFSWLFFRASSFEITLECIKRLCDWGSFTMLTVPVVTMLFLGVFGQYTPRKYLGRLEIQLARCPVFVRGIILAIAIFIIDLLGPTGIAPFIYFQF